MSNMTGEASFSSGNRGDVNMLSTGAGTSSNPSQQAPVKRKRNLPGTPDPEAEVVALSPKTLMATNRFVCEICNKGFQRDQNLQLHRRGHNLPWKLRQRTSKEIKKRVYICPETSCVHHHPSRALGDLTGIKKHFCRKHGEKKWKCDKCSKRYAVQSDWKAHSKTCGTREYRCDCGTLFSRRDSFITHRAFCDALAEESARLSGGINAGVGQVHNHLGIVQGAGGAAASMSHIMGAPPPSRFGGLNPSDGQFNPSAYREAFGTNAGPSGGVNPRARLPLWLGQGTGDPQPSNSMDVTASGFFNKSMLGSSEYDDSHGAKPLPALLTMTSSNSGSLYSNLFTSGSMNAASSALQNNDSYGGNWTDRSSGNARLSLSTSTGLTTNSSSVTNNINDGSNPPSSVYHGGHSAQMSATALLQKAAQMGATTSNSSMIRGFGMPGSNNNTVGLGLLWQGTPPDQERGHGTVNLMLNNTFNGAHNWNPFMKGSLEHMTEGGGGAGGSGGYNQSSARSAENAGLNDLMNSFSGSPSGVSLNAMHSSFSSSMADSGNLSALNMIPTRPNTKDGTRQSFQMASMMMQGGSNQPRNEDGSEDGLTRDFLGVGGIQLGGMHARTFSQRDHFAAATFTSLGSGMDMTSFSTRRAENIHPIGANHSQSPVRSWDAT
ncbi:hypothetical protein SUGI_0770660 [Cryptomeria japonica]|uniref:zinc finger protein NUTCRACKER n=1 Tax=Cryptomeria japonica TaxID=3369 RepID=UPI002414B2B0|nr:zinc finger protein NUTCRACKER [Cryptomeria japonica]GLJ37876.1 hypothetical protein SUGI_0770660 [Cryptomeria japonica]